MKPKTLMTACILAATLASAWAASSGGEPWTVSSDSAENVAHYSPPVLANGDIGMLVDYRNCQFQDIPSLKSIHSAWDEYRPETCRQGRRSSLTRLATFGHAEETVSAGGDSSAAPVSWSQRLDVFKAESVCRNGYANGAEIDSTAFVAAGKPVFAVRKSFAGNVESYTFRWLFRAYGGGRPDGMEFSIRPGTIEWLCPGAAIKPGETAKNSPEWVNEKSSARPLSGKIELRCSSPTARLRVEDGDTLCATVEKPVGDIDFFVVFSDTMDDVPLSGDAVASAGWDGLKASHEAEWAKFWSSSGVSIPDAALLRTYQTSLYNLKCWSTKWAVPVGMLPSHWNGHYFGFSFNAAAFAAAGHFEEAKRIGRFWKKVLPLAKQRAGSHERADGLTNHEAGARFAWESIEDGREAAPTGRWMDHFMNLGTIAAECWNAWLYTGDRDFLAETYPVMRDCAHYFRTWLVQELADGRTVIGPVCDLERLPCPVRNAFLTTCAAIYAMERAADAATVLGVDAGYVPAWRKTAAALRRDLPRGEGRYLAYERGKEISVGTLGGLFPYNVLSRDDDAQLAAVDYFDRNGIRVGNMYNVGTRICTWYAAWLAAAYARLLDGEGAYRNIALASASVGFFNEIFEINEPTYRSCPWSQGAPATFAQAFHDMLIQSEGDVVRIAPAVPAAWRDFSFTLRAHDDIEVSAKFAKGRLDTLRVRAGERHSGREKRFLLPGGGVLTATAAREWKELAPAADDVVFVRSSSLSLGFDTRSGRVVKVVAADGTDLSPKAGADLFKMKLTRTDDFSTDESVSSEKAARFRHEPIADGLRLVWEDLDGKLSRVECTVRGSATDRKLRFGIALSPANGWAVTIASYPCINFSGRIGESVEDDRLLTGSKQGISDNLASLPVNQWHIHPQQPGPLAVQTAFWWDPSLLVYTAAEDDKGDVKCVGAMRTGSGDMQLWWDRKCFDAAPACLDYDFVFAAVCGTKDEPVTWHDGADIYRDWARTTTRLCPVPVWKRSNLPACIAEAPAVTLFNRPWFNDIAKMHRWVGECWSRVMPDVPLVTILWGWERYATWVHPHSFPCNPSDEAFVSLVGDFAAKNVHAFPWPSGYNWTLSYGTNEAGVVQYDWREDFRRRAASHACITRDGKVVERAPYWLHGGAYAKMCGGDEWTRRWFANDVTSELARRGCMIVSVDQNNGGQFDPCWSRSHPHAPGEGRWKTVAARCLLEEMTSAIRKIHGKSAVTYEDPNEHCNDLGSLQLVRDIKWKGEWASVYNFVYHEYMPVFQAEPRSRNDLVWMAYSAAEGQMPRIMPDMRDLEPGGMDGWYFDYMKRWISLFRGEGRPFLACGRRIKPPRIACGTVTRTDGCSSPAVFVAAYESDKGEKAVVLANATHDAQDVQVMLKNRKVDLTLAPREIRLFKKQKEVTK